MGFQLQECYASLLKLQRRQRDVRIRSARIGEAPPKLNLRWMADVRNLMFACLVAQIIRSPWLRSLLWSRLFWIIISVAAYMVRYPSVYYSVRRWDLSGGYDE